MSDTNRSNVHSTRTRWLLAGAVLIGALVLGATLLADRGGSSGTDLATSSRARVTAMPTGVNERFWTAMVDAGIAAGLHDGYRECLEPASGVVLFDIDRFGELVNPAYDAGYLAAGSEIRAACSELVADAANLSDAERDDHRRSISGASFDTADAHPDFGKGDDLGRRELIDAGCDRDRAIDVAGPPTAWPADHPSEFLAGYLAGLSSTVEPCPS